MPCATSSIPGCGGRFNLFIEHAFKATEQPAHLRPHGRELGTGGTRSHIPLMGRYIGEVALPDDIRDILAVVDQAEHAAGRQAESHPDLAGPQALGALVGFLGGAESLAATGLGGRSQ